jgi:uncharacterized protein (DUF1810 family)
MWFIFPQIKGLGRSEMAQKFAISSPEEAEAYLAHPILGPRLQECTRIVAELEAHSAEDIFGYPDDMKFRSSMTLFARGAVEKDKNKDKEIFQRCLEKYFGGALDRLTLAALPNF